MPVETAARHVELVRQAVNFDFRDAARNESATRRSDPVLTPEALARRGDRLR
jgi:hypothetical protein